MDAVRRALRDQRRALDDDARRVAAEAIARLAGPLVTHVPALGAYVAVQGEVDPSPLVRMTWAHGGEVYVPKVTIGRSMVFAAWREGERTVRGAFGVPEPEATVTVRPASRLDVVLVPLVAFDRAGTRLGTGAGFYDRAFAFRLDQPRGSRPLLVGLAYSWQEVPHLERRSWDVPLDYIVTEREVIQPDAVTRPDTPPAPR
jgi:5-formyltetrahydrofolate cyclo-ligase